MWTLVGREGTAVAPWSYGPKVSGDREVNAYVSGFNVSYQQSKIYYRRILIAASDILCSAAALFLRLDH